MTVESAFKDIADAIRERAGTSGIITPAAMPQAILDIPAGGVELLTQAQWNALSTAEKQAKGLVAIEQAASGYNRGILVNGADYIGTLLPSSDPADILAEGWPANYEGGSSWGGLSIAGTPTINQDGSLYMPGNSVYAYYPGVSGQSMTIYGVIQQAGGTYLYQRFISIYTASSSLREQMFCTYQTNNTQLIWSSFGDDTTITGFTATNKHLYAIAVNADTMKARFFLDGVYLGEKSCAAIGLPYWTANGGGNQPLNGNMYYGAIVGSYESNDTILANSARIMQYFNM